MNSSGGGTNMLAKWNELDPRNNKYTKKQIDLSDKIANKIAQIDIKQWEKTRIPIFHRSNAIYSLRIEGDEQARESEWKYWAVYKDLNNQFMEWQVSKAFLDETFDPEFMKDFRKWFKFNNYMFLRNKKLSFVPVEKAQKYFEMKENAGIDKIWEYKKKENDETVLYLRAVVSFQQHTDKKIEELKTKKLGLFAADVVKKHVIRWALCLQPRQTDPTIHKYSKVKEEIVRAVFGVTKYAELIKDIYDWYEIDIEDCAEKNKANLKDYAKKRKDELDNRKGKKQKTANISKAIKNASVLRRPSEKFCMKKLMCQMKTTIDSLIMKTKTSSLRGLMKNFICHMTPKTLSSTVLWEKKTDCKSIIGILPMIPNIIMW
jgi:hypothetical protein